MSYGGSLCYIHIKFTCSQKKKLSNELPQVTWFRNKTSVKLCQLIYSVN